MNPDMTITESDVSEVESLLQIHFPIELRGLFLEHNGAEPTPYVLEDPERGICTTVSETLPLKSSQGMDTAVDAYEYLVVQKQIVSREYFPFAIDSGGDYFLVKCDHGEENVFFLDSARYPPIRLVDLGMRMDEFWNSLKDE